MNLQRPNLYDYKEPVSYLKAQFDFERYLRPDLSVRKWANEIKLSPDYLLAIFKAKKKLSLNIAPLLAEYFQLDPTELKYLEMMIRYSLALGLVEKKNLELVMNELTQLKGTRALVEDQSVFSHWIHMAILSMAKVSHFACTSESIQDFLEYEVLPTKIDEALARLESLDLIFRDESGHYKRRYDHTTSKNDAFKKAPHDYFEQVSELAKKGAQFDAEEREYQCFSLAISHEDLPQFKEMIRNFRAKMASFAQGRDSDQVYQMNMQFFPMTKRYPEPQAEGEKQLTALTLGLPV